MSSRPFAGRLFHINFRIINYNIIKIDILHGHLPSIIIIIIHNFSIIFLKITFHSEEGSQFNLPKIVIVLMGAIATLLIIIIISGLVIP